MSTTHTHDWKHAPEKGFSGCRCGAQAAGVPFTPPTKRTTGQCMGLIRGCSIDSMGLWTHVSDCPALSPLQPQPGDEPDTLTKLTRLVRTFPELCSPTTRMEEAEQALAIISEAAEERALLKETMDLVAQDLARFVTKVVELEAKLAAQQETINALSNKATAALRMGQQQGRVELATELLEANSRGLSIFEILDRTVADDAEH